MAISGGDGSIILSTKVDEKGLKSGMTSMKKLITTTSKAFLAVGAAAATATVKITKMAVTAYADYEQLIGGVETLFKDSAGKVVEYANQAFHTAGVSANEYMQQVTSFSASLLSSLAGNTDKAADIANMALIDISDNANKMGSSLESVTLAYQGFAKGQYQLLDNLKLGYGGTKTEMERLLKDAEAYLATQGKTAKFSINNLADVYTAINAIQQKLDIAGTTAREAETTITGSLGMVKASWQNLLTAMAGGGDLDRALNNFVYSLEKFTANIVPVIERVLIGLGVAIQRSLPMLVQTVVTALIQQIPNIVIAVYNMIIGLFKGIVLGIKALFSGGTAKATEAIKGNVDNISAGAGSAADKMNDVADATKRAGQEAKKSLAAFDDLNILASNASASAEGGATSVSVPSVEVSAGNDNVFKDAEQKIKETLSSFAGIAGISMIAIGLILLYFGKIGWGIGFILAGAVTLVTYVAQNKNEIKKNVKKFLDENVGLIIGVSSALLVLGIILCVMGVSLPIGIALIVAGAGILVTEVVLNWDKIKTSITSFLSENLGLIMGVASALLVLGIILCVTGVALPFGIALIVAGAGVLVTEAVLNWDKIKTSITSFLSDNLGLIIGVASAMLVLGIILCVTGVALPFGIALIVAGAGTLVTEAVLNWDKIKTSITSFLSDNLGLIVGVASALLVLGIILCVTGVALPFGIALIVAGAGVLVTEVVLNWDKIKTNINKFLKENSGLIIGVASALLVLGILLCVTGVALPIGIALIIASAGILVTEVVLNWDKIKTSITQFFKENAGLIIGVASALLVLGIILLFTGVGIPLAIGLILAGGGLLASEVALNWDFIVDKVEEIWKKVKDYWNQKIAPIFTAKWWSDLAKKAGNGLIGGFEGAVNGIITLFERMINYVVNGLNKISLTIPDWVPGIGGNKFGVNLKNVSLGRVSIPRLAKGTVLPGGDPYLAIINDNPAGKPNIEAPANLIKQMAMEAIQEAGFTGGQTVREEHYYLGETELMSIIYRLARGGERLNGENLVVGGAF